MDLQALPLHVHTKEMRMIVMYIHKGTKGP